MATLLHRTTGNTPGYEVRLYDPDGRRVAVYLGGRKYSKKTATELKEVVEHLVFYRDNAVTIPDKKTIAWLGSASPGIREKLANAGLIEIPKTYTLGELWDSFLKTKVEMKESTIAIYDHVKRRFFAFFKESEPLETLGISAIKDVFIAPKENRLKRICTTFLTRNSARRFLMACTTLRKTKVG